MSLTYTRTLSEAELAALLHDLPGEDGVTAWIEAMIAGKIANCRKRMAAQGLAAVRSGAIAMKNVPDLKDTSLAAALAAQPGYKDRAARDRMQATEVRHPTP